MISSAELLGHPRFDLVTFIFGMGDMSSGSMNSFRQSSFSCEVDGVELVLGRVLTSVGLDDGAVDVVALMKGTGL